VRRAAAGAGFADGMFVGEDVDFIWRLSAAGWRVRYEPSATMGHDHRVRFRAWFSRRADYGTSAAALEQRHPGAVRPLYASWWTVGAWAAALSGRPVTAAALTAAATTLLARRLSTVTGETWPNPVGTWPLPAGTSPPTPYPGRRAEAWRLAARLAGGGTLAAGRPIGSALSRTWWPLAVPAAIAFPALRRPVAALIVVPPLLDWADRRPPLDPSRYVAARLLDDAAYSLGVWQGCLRRRTIRPLFPMLGSRRPPAEGGGEPASLRLYVRTVNPWFRPMTWGALRIYAQPDQAARPASSVTALAEHGRRRPEVRNARSSKRSLAIAMSLAVAGLTATVAVAGPTAAGAAVGKPAVGGPGRWSQVTASGTPIIADVGLVRGADGILHVIWEQGTAAGKEKIVDSPIGPGGTPAARVTIANSLYLATDPDATATPSGLDVFWNGIQTNKPSSPEGTFEATRPVRGGHWNLVGSTPPLPAVPFTSSSDSAGAGSDGKPCLHRHRLAGRPA
jgi:hypothetical protein